MRQKIRTKNLKYNFLRFDKEKSIETFYNAGWHFNNLMSPEKISLKLKTFAHSEFSSDEFSSKDTIRDKIRNRQDLFNRGHKYEIVKLNKNFPKYILENISMFDEFIV